MSPHLYAYLSSAHDCLRGSSQLLVSYGNQEASLGAGLLDGSSHKPVDKLFHDHLARKRLRNFHHRCKIELFDRCLDRAHWTRRAPVQSEQRMELIQLPHLAVGAPTKIAVPSVPQIGMGNCLETAMRKESGRKFVGQSLVLHESMLPSGLYRPLVQVFGVEFTPLKASYLRRDQQRAVREIVRTLLRPCLELAVMLVKHLEMPRAVL